MSRSQLSQVIPTLLFSFNCLLGVQKTWDFRDTWDRWTCQLRVQSEILQHNPAKGEQLESADLERPVSQRVALSLRHCSFHPHRMVCVLCNQGAGGSRKILQRTNRRKGGGVSLAYDASSLLAGSIRSLVVVVTQDAEEERITIPPHPIGGHAP